VHSLPSRTFLAEVAGSWSLPEDPSSAPTTAAEFAAWSWWMEHYLRPGTQLVDFVMLNRLAELLVRTTPQLRRALRITYPFVFVDEFQDTTGAQFTFLHSVFGGSATITAVGDRKQRIMGFAGALHDAIDRYVEDFGATAYELTWNFRSSADLVLLQHIIASRLDRSVIEAVSKAEVEEGHVAANLWTYSSPNREATHIAEWIATDIASSGRSAADFALVARQKVAELEGRLCEALAAHGIGLRNDDALYGTSRLQDLLKHDVVRLVVGVLRLAAEPRGLGNLWLDTRAVLARIHGTVDDAVSDRALSDELAEFTRELRSWLNATPMPGADPVEVVARAASIVGGHRLNAFVKSQHRGEDANQILDSLAMRLADVMPGANCWARAFIDVEARDAVTLLTIHRSKGLEYHTVFFLGLDDAQWWSYRYDVDEATSAFFVGLSRAAQRIIFTCTTSRARSGEIADLYRMLDAAQVEERNWADK
jgi:superfamily I DNA/RNA helicase